MRYWIEYAGALKRELAAALDHERLAELHRRRPWRHFLITARHAALSPGAPGGA